MLSLEYDSAMNKQHSLSTETIKQLALEHGFEQCGITHIDLGQAEARLIKWLDSSYHGEMEYMSAHGTKRSRPDELLPQTRSIISVSMNYLTANTHPIDEILDDQTHAVISRYGLGRDYHKLLRRRLNQLAQAIEQRVGSYQWRVFVDSAPVMEKPIAQLAGLGWVGKHTNLVSRNQGSWFFLGEIYTDLALQNSHEEQDHCGRCTRCIDICPTQAIVAPYKLDSRRCISYLTIEHKGVIPMELRAGIGNRIFGCDDCQLVCPWNRFSHLSHETDFLPRHRLDRAELLELFAWDETTFLEKTEGSAIRRLGYQQWQRNLAVAMGNSGNPKMIDALRAQLSNTSSLVKEHIIWALDRLGAKA